MPFLSCKFIGDVWKIAGSERAGYHGSKDSKVAGMSYLVMNNIRKTFPSSGTVANDGANLSVEAGEIHAIVGENGAGKTTLMKILAGLLEPDAGTITIAGKPAVFRSPQDTKAFHIGMVHQHFIMVPEFTVAENIVFGQEPRKAGFLFDTKIAEKEAARMIERFGFSLEPDALAADLSVSERQQLEILRQMYRETQLLILDEPTAVLTEQEIQHFFELLKTLKGQGITVLIITHKIREVKEIADRVTVMRDGRTIATLNTGDISEYDLSCLMMGSASCLDFSARRRNPAGARTILDVKNLSITRKHHSMPLLHQVSFSVASGEILGLCGISGNGLKEIEEVLAGFLQPSSGTLLFQGKALPKSRTAPWLPNGIAYVPSDRMKRGVVLQKTWAENYIALDRKRFFPRGIADRKSARETALRRIQDFSIKAQPDSRMDELSGGNIQKSILARELADEVPALCVLCEPTWGLDSLSASAMHEKILSLRDSGAAVLLISSDIDEIMALSDRIAVLRRGTITAQVHNSSDVTREYLGALMLGIHNEH